MWPKIWHSKGLGIYDVTFSGTRVLLFVRLREALSAFSAKLQAPFASLLQAPFQHKDK